MNKLIQGWSAIEAKEKNRRVTLYKFADPIEGKRYNLTLDQAREIAKQDPSLIYTTIPCQNAKGGE